MSAPASPRRRGPGSRADENHPTRREILDAAVGLAEQGGLRSLSVAQVTAAAGYAKGTFYVHFRDRSALLVALHRWFHDTVFERVVSATADNDAGPDRARGRLIAFLDACRELSGVRALLLDARSEPAVAAEADSRNRQAAMILAADLTDTAHPRETARILVLAAADIAARESAANRKLSGARQALLDLV